MERSAPSVGAMDAKDDIRQFLLSRRNGRLDVRAANTLGRALNAPVFDQDPTGVPNIARFLFLSPRSSGFRDPWDRIASDAVAILRAEAARSSAISTR